MNEARRRGAMGRYTRVVREARGVGSCRKPPVPPTQVAVTLVTAPTMQVTLDNPGSVGLDTGLVRRPSSRLVQTSLHWSRSW